MPYNGYKLSTIVLNFKTKVVNAMIILIRCSIQFVPYYKKETQLLAH